jgi:hypothetical protein
MRGVIGNMARMQYYRNMTSADNIIYTKVVFMQWKNVFVLKSRGLKALAMFSMVNISYHKVEC